MTPQPTKTNGYYRARITAFKEHSKDKTYGRQLQYGFVPDEFIAEYGEEEFDGYIRARWHSDDNDRPLTFTELATFNTWFDMHPEKICGKMKASSSLYMPVTVVGTRRDVETAIDNGIRDNHTTAPCLVATKRNKYQGVYRQKLKDDFGFPMVNVDVQDSDEQAEEFCKNIYEDFAKLAERLGKPYQIMSLYGNLGISVGANTIKSGVGAYYRGEDRVMAFRKRVFFISHEWFHALDHYLSYVCLKQQPKYLVSKYITTVKIPDSPVLVAMKHLVKILPETRYYQTVKTMCRRYSDMDEDYWLSNHEMLARAFETYILLKDPVSLSLSNAHGGTYPSVSMSNFTAFDYDKDLQSAFDELIKYI